MGVTLLQRLDLRLDSLPKFLVDGPDIHVALVQLLPRLDSGAGRVLGRLFSPKRHQRVRALHVHHPKISEPEQTNVGGSPSVKEPVTAPQLPLVLRLRLSQREILWRLPPRSPRLRSPPQPLLSFGTATETPVSRP